MLLCEHIIFLMFKCGSTCSFLKPLKYLIFQKTSITIKMLHYTERSKLNYTNRY